MATCFLFAQHFTDEYCLGLRLDEQGLIDAPLEKRSFDAFRALQAHARTIVVLPTESSSLHQLELPWLGERKARAAIPYALEEQIAQSVSAVHVAFDQQHYQNKQYLVAVIDRALLEGLMARLDAAALGFHMITLDWFALKAGEACVSETSLLVNDDAFKGPLSAATAEIYLSSRMSQTPVLMFNDSSPIICNTIQAIGASGDHPSTIHDEGYSKDKGLSTLAATSRTYFYAWTAQRLLKDNVMNLCQGELQHNTRQELHTPWYQASAALAVLWLVSIFAVNGFISHKLTSQIAALDQKIAVIYREFFPQARQVISPKFRVGQLLKEGRSGQDRALWQLDDMLALAINNEAFTIQQLRYQDQMLSVSLLAKDFAALDGLELRLQQAGAKVTQAQAASHEQQVIATLELRL